MADNDEKMLNPFRRFLDCHFEEQAMREISTTVLQERQRVHEALKKYLGAFEPNEGFRLYMLFGFAIDKEQMVAFFADCLFEEDDESPLRCMEIALRKHMTREQMEKCFVSDRPFKTFRNPNRESSSRQGIATMTGRP